MKVLNVLGKAPSKDHTPVSTRTSPLQAQFQKQQTVVTVKLVCFQVMDEEARIFLLLLRAGDFAVSHLSGLLNQMLVLASGKHFVWCDLASVALV